jgi:hypothetical protein
MEEIRAKLKAQAERGKGRTNRPQGSGDNASYAFWNIPENTSATIRFLPDGDQNNTLFWVKREVIRLPFQGVVGGDYPTNKEVTVTVPCIDMFGMNCPIIAATRPWWKDPEREDLARKYWKKKSYIFQGFVVNSPFAEENLPENPIRRFVINPSIFTIIEKSLVDPDMEDVPTDYDAGSDFKISKGKQGEYANYGTSTWARKPRSLSEAERGAIEQYGLFDLKSFLGRIPDQDEIDAIKTMFECSIAGEPYDMEAFGKYYRPYGGRDDAGETATRTAFRANPEPAATVTESVETETVVAPTTAKRNPQEILAQLRSRTKTGN